MDARSESFFTHVEPDLVKVLRTAAPISGRPWLVVYGIRTVSAEAQCVATGHSTTMHSRHIADKNGLAAAVDVAALIDGKQVSFAPGQEAKVFGDIALQIKTAATILGIPIEWGGGLWEVL